MNESTEAGPSTAELEDLTLLLENRTFVDYFNTFLCLPVFGQHVFYNYMEMEFEFEPPIKNRRHLYLDRRQVLRWLCTERLRLFKKSALYIEYRLCMQLRDTVVELQGLNIEPGQDTTVFTKNVIGTTKGMLLFRESMRGTGGENVYRCWKDIEAWKPIEDPARKLYNRRVIYAQYINENSATEVVSALKVKVMRGILNFDLVPESGIHQQILDSLTDNTFRSFVDSDEAVLNLQTILLYALRKYWLPRHILHICQTADKETLGVLMKPAPGDAGNERRFRCRYMFPTIYQESSINSPATTVLVSQSANDLRKDAMKTPSPSSMSDDDLDAEEEDKVEPTDLFSLWGGPAKEIEAECPATSSSSSPSLSDTPDETGHRKSQFSNMGIGANAGSPIPIVLTSYLGGKKRTLVGNFPATTNRVTWSLASDALAFGPFREFLEQNGHDLDLKYLGFWTDVRNYLDLDEHVTDRYGKPLRLQLAHWIVDVYLSKDGAGSDIFSETLKMSMFTAISTNNNVSLLCMAQDIVQKSLREPLKLYIEHERRSFLKQVRGHRCQLDRKQMRTIDQAAKITKLKPDVNAADVDPTYLFNCVTLEDTDTVSPTPVSHTTPCDPAGSRPASRPVTTFHVSITEEQMLKAMELAVLCSEYGVSMMVPQYLTKPAQLVDILYSDYGSLHVSRVPRVRHEWLRSLTEKPEIDIETIRVSRKVLLDTITIADVRTDDFVPRVRGRMTRRTGLTVERPNKPKSLMEVLSNPIQYDFFKRFMMMNKMSLPVLFWRAVEDLQGMSNGKARQIRVTQITRKFFGKYSKYGAMLDCDEEIIRQIPNMEKVTPGILICAQAAVFRSLERKWYPLYVDSFPPADTDSANSPENIISYSVQTGIVKNFELAADLIHKTKKIKKRSLGCRKTLALWRNFSKAMTTFVKAVSSRSESQLFEMFLKYEVEREKQSHQREVTGQMPQAERSTMAENAQSTVQTRVVVRNRLIIMNRLPADLRFWTEVRKYQNLVDSAAQKKFVSEQDTEFLTDKARSIICCYLASEILPKIQVNIPNDMAINITNSLASDGPKRGLFHDALILIFPTLYHFYRKFSEEWMKGNIPDEYFDSIEHTIKDRVATTPHNELELPDFTAIQPHDIKTSTQATQDENMVRIHFSISDGVTIIYPQVNTQRTSPVQGRRMTKHSLHTLIEDTSPQKGGTGGHGDKKESAHAPKGRDKQNQKHLEGKRNSINSIRDRKKSEKIIVKESDQSPSGPSRGKKGSIDKARRLSFLVESLNQEKAEKIKEQNRLFSKLMSFDEVVSVALAELPQDHSVESLKDVAKE